jgi:hypothetical protein
MTFRMMAVIAATTTAAAAASAGAVWYAMSPQSGAPAATAPNPQAPAGSVPPPAAQDSVEVCIGGDQIVRALLPQGDCPAGHKLVKLESEDDALCKLCPPSEDAPKPDSGDNKALNDIERRIRALESAPYFEVVNKEGRPVFVVSQDGVRIFDKAGVPKAGFGTYQSGGYFTVTSGFANASITANGVTGGMQFVEDGLTRLTLSGRDDGGASLRVPSGNGVIAGMGVSKDGPGTLLIGTRTGQVKTTFSVPGGRAMLQVSDGESYGAISLMEQGIGGGMLQIDSKNGAIVKMGHVDNRYGIVMAGPNPGPPLIAKSGLPGGWFLGCGSSAPPSCIPVVP